jgi:hypothetical protein
VVKWSLLAFHTLITEKRTANRVSEEATAYMQGQLDRCNQNLDEFMDKARELLATEDPPFAWQHLSVHVSATLAVRLGDKYQQFLADTTAAAAIRLVAAEDAHATG